jgi:hypothetical protein
MRSPVIIIPAPFFNLFPGIIQRQKPIDIKILVFEAAVE